MNNINLFAVNHSLSNRDTRAYKTHPFFASGENMSSHKVIYRCHRGKGRVEMNEKKSDRKEGKEKMGKYWARFFVS